MIEAELAKKIRTIVRGIYATGHDYGLHEAEVPEGLFDMWENEVMQEANEYINEYIKEVIGDFELCNPKLGQPEEEKMHRNLLRADQLKRAGLWIPRRHIEV